MNQSTNRFSPNIIFLSSRQSDCGQSDCRQSDSDQSDPGQFDPGQFDFHEDKTHLIDLTVNNQEEEGEDFI